jgi:hypothetical protein
MTFLWSENRTVRCSNRNSERKINTTEECYVMEKAMERDVTGRMPGVIILP